MLRIHLVYEVEANHTQLGSNTYHYWVYEELENATAHFYERRPLGGAALAQRLSFFLFRFVVLVIGACFGAPMMPSTNQTRIIIHFCPFSGSHHPGN